MRKLDSSGKIVAEFGQIVVRPKHAALMPRNVSRSAGKRPAFGEGWIAYADWSNTTRMPVLQPTRSQTGSRRSRRRPSRCRKAAARSAGSARSSARTRRSARAQSRARSRRILAGRTLDRRLPSRMTRAPERPVRLWLEPAAPGRDAQGRQSAFEYRGAEESDVFLLSDAKDVVQTLPKSC
jgi:hypothetical protein